MAQVAVCSQINTKHKYSVGRAYCCWMLNCWCITWPVGFKGLITLNRRGMLPLKITMSCSQSLQTKVNKVHRLNFSDTSRLNVAKNICASNDPFYMHTWMFLMEFQPKHRISWLSFREGFLSFFSVKLRQNSLRNVVSLHFLSTRFQIHYALISLFFRAMGNDSKYKHI